METVSLLSGRVSGVRVDADRCTVFKGIPFAAPPVGELRYRPPRPVAPWNGVLRADRFASACLQPLHGYDHLLGQFSFAPVPECGISEHCLFLNVWTPARSPADKLPVIVWLYGGGFRVGSGSHPVNDGEALARQGVILVAPNYRLASLGFLAHPDLTRESGSSGNYGVLDVVAALRWVHDNIAAFGGDPDCVTLFGESAGGALVNVLMAMPSAKGLFHRAIVHSAGRMRGGPMGVMKDRQAAEAEGVKFMESLGARTPLAMRLMAADRTYGQPRQWSPIIDGVHLQEAPQVVFDRGAQAQVPLLTGFNRNEAASFPSPEWQNLQGFTEFAQKTFGDDASWVLQQYGVHDDASALARSYDLRRDITFAWQTWQLARSHARTAQAGSYLYFFDAAPPLPADAHYHGPPPPGGYGAFHGAELWYAFNSLNQKPEWHWSDADRALAESTCAHWAQFARSGNPTLPGGPAWPQFGAGAQQAMCFQHPDAASGTPAARVGAVPNQAMLNFLEKRFGG